jgi:hypothetical protein
MKQDPAVAYFYSARAHRSRGALWPSFAPALIGELRSSEHSGPDEVQNAAVSVALLYPTTLRSKFERFGPYSLKVGVNAPVAGSDLRVVVR